MDALQAKILAVERTCLEELVHKESAMMRLEDERTLLHEQVQSMMLAGRERDDLLLDLVAMRAEMEAVREDRNRLARECEHLKVSMLDVDAVTKCVYCCDVDSQVALKPCGHVCLCTRCFDLGVCKGMCPMCRDPYKGFLRLYFS